MANPNRQYRSTDQRYPSVTNTSQPQQPAVIPRYPSSLSNQPPQNGRHPSQVHPYARLPSHRDVSQTKTTANATRSALQPTSASQTVINASQPFQQQGHSREISHVHNPGLEAAPVRVTEQSHQHQQERESLYGLPHPTLYKPKSKLRLRLKLTPPHPPGTKLLIPSAPLPKHITKDDPIMVKALAKVVSNDRKGDGKENVETHQRRQPVNRDAQRDSGMSFGNPTKTSGFDELDMDGQDYPPIHAQARAHQAYQRAQLGHGRVGPSDDTGKKHDSRYPSNSTNDERIRALEEAHLRRAAPEPPKEPVFTLRRGQTETRHPVELEIPEGNFYQLDPTPVVSPIRVQGVGFQTITAATPQPIQREEENDARPDEREDSGLLARSAETSESETTIDLSLTVSRACESEDETRQAGDETFAHEDSRLDISYAESQGNHGVEVAFKETISITHPVQVRRDHEQEEREEILAKRNEVETRDLDDVNDSSFDNSGDISASHEGNETGWTSTSGDDSGVAEDSRDRKSGKGKEENGEQMNDVLSLSDRMLADRFDFQQEIGFGNWGSVWSVKPRKAEFHPFHRQQNDKVPPVGAAIRAQHHMEKIAVKLVHRKKEPTTAARVRALWSEMKVIRTLRLDPHPSIIGFDSFIITPSYAIVTMPFLSHLMPVGLPEETARSYFLQLTSAIAYLHDRGITHNDIKPANILLSHSDVPVMVDFGFAQRWDLSNSDGRGPTEVSGLAVSSNRSGSRQVPFWSEISWGTPEYLDPPRALGQWHDERLSDVWALGITFFEILTGRTPFEAHASEDFSSQDQLNVYYERTVRGEWLGEWEMSISMERLLKAMICPDHRKRLTASQANRHTALQPQEQQHNDQMSTPPFVRTATGHHEHRAKRRREPQPKAKTAKGEKIGDKPRVHANETAPHEAVAVSPARNAPIRASDLLTPQKKSVNNRILIVSPRIESEKAELDRPKQTPVAAQNGSSPFSLDSEKPQEQPSGRSRINAMSTIEALGKEKVRVEHVTARSAAREHQMKKVKSYDVLRKQAPVAHDNVESSQSTALRRPASAMALRTDIQDVSQDSTSKKAREAALVVDHKRDRCVSQHRRHTRIVSEGCIRAMIEAPQTELPRELERQAISQETRRESKDAVIEHGHKASPSRRVIQPQTEPAAIEALSKIREAPLAPVDSNDLDERLTEIASWVKSVEQIVLDARVALEEAQYPRSKTPVEFERSISRLSNLTNRRSVDNFVKLARDNQSTLGDNAGTTKPPSHRPSMSMETGPSYHLRRQRSDLTNFRSMQFQPIVEQELPESVPSSGLWSSSKAAIGLDRKLKSHRSTGDLNKMMMHNQDPYEAGLRAQHGIQRDQGEGWSNSRGKSKSGLSLFAHRENSKGKPADAHHQSRLKNFFRGILKR